jgi:hypothetical protein
MLAVFGDCEATLLQLLLLRGRYHPAQIPHMIPVRIINWCNIKEIWQTRDRILGFTLLLILCCVSSNLQIVK